jgi:hypothetical protein
MKIASCGATTAHVRSAAEILARWRHNRGKRA